MNTTVLSVAESRTLLRSAGFFTDKPVTSWNGTASSLAITPARHDFPVPGGPRSNEDGHLLPSAKQTSRVVRTSSSMDFWLLHSRCLRLEGATALTSFIGFSLVGSPHPGRTGAVRQVGFTSFPRQTTRQRRQGDIFLLPGRKDRGGA